MVVAHACLSALRWQMEDQEFKVILTLEHKRPSIKNTKLKKKKRENGVKGEKILKFNIILYIKYIILHII